MCTEYCPCEPIELPYSNWTVYYNEIDDRNYTGEYTSFKDCYDDLREEYEDGTNAYLSGFSSYENDGFFDFLKAVEDEFSCSGLCEVQIFYFFKSIQE